MCVCILSDFMYAYLKAVVCEVQKYFYALSQTVRCPNLIYTQTVTDPFSEMLE
jgi:hypothetical protein